MQLSIINKIETDSAFSQHINIVEKIGDVLASPARLFFGNTYKLVDVDGVPTLKCNETFAFRNLKRLVQKTCVIVLLPLSIISSLFGMSIKCLARMFTPNLKEKYSFRVLVNARTEKNFSGTLPPNPLSPNCVNSQRKSIWGSLYNVDPIEVPESVNNPVAIMKQILENHDYDTYKHQNMKLTEEKGNYLHYEYTVKIPSGPLKGVYTDDVDIFYNEKERRFEIRSASRTGFRDATHLNRKVPGANKKRVEAIRELFNKNHIVTSF